MQRNPAKSFQLLLPFLLSVACESMPAIPPTPGCQPGTSEACECVPGQPGTRTCLSSMEFGACLCTSPAADASMSMDLGFTTDTSLMTDAGMTAADAMMDAGMTAADAAMPPMMDTGMTAADATMPPMMDAGMTAADATMPPMMDAGTGGTRPSCAAVVNPMSHTLCLDILTSVATGTRTFARVRLIRAPGLSDPAGFQFDLVSDPGAISLPSTSVGLPPTNAAAPSFMVAANNSMNAPHLPGSVTALMFSLDPNARTASMNGDLIEFEIVSRGPTGDFELMFDNVVISSLSSMAQPFAVYHGTIKVY
jgi:hypothetical protein